MEIVNDSGVGLNVGGKIYQTSRNTLTKYPNSFFFLLLEGTIPSKRDDQGNYLIDQDGEVFRHVLNFLRSGELLTLPEGFKDFKLLESQADFFLLDELKKVIQNRMSDGLLFDDGGVGLNVGGKIYQTSRNTLTKYPNSFFSLLLEGAIPSKRDDQGNYLIDRDGEIFRHVLNFLRSGELLTLPEGFKEYELLESEADFFLLDELKKVIQNRMSVGLLFDDGKVFNTTKETLMKESGAFFPRMLAGEIEVTRDPQGNYVMNRDGSLFHHILAYLRDGGVLTDITLDDLNRLLNEADYFGLDVFKEHIESIRFMQTRRNALRYLHFYHCVNSPCFVYKNFQDHSHVCPYVSEIMKGVFAGMAVLERINRGENVSVEDIISYFCKQLDRSRTNTPNTTRVELSPDCTRLDFEPF
ncbi:uncharacterized protein LOC576395 [Strongylocentrotus purpuratus]|uniref:BTB domain-containing protein n=1 Tax=Strongylocentrotus purpuratus TaxID=7668 RepID=A0A7M7GJJ7_STRPU|nr:uncharacterized protein LOC576395 [Strongylocentrotus purpuratus]